MFDHYIAVDWAMSNMAIARMTRKSNKIHVMDVPASIKDIQLYLGQLKGKTCLRIEETTTSQWLYTELYEYVDEIIICDPYRNRLLSEGPKTDKIDASKLVRLLRADLLKKVFHSNSKFIEMRKLVSAYEDLVKAGVRVKNQHDALFRAVQRNKKLETLDGVTDNFVLKGLEASIESYELEKDRYKREFKRLQKKHIEIRRISEIPGIAEVRSIQIISRVVDAHRFPSRNHFLSYCGLVKLEKISGNRSYGKRKSRYCRMLKGVFQQAAFSVIGKNNPLNDYYDFLINEKNYSARNAKMATARRIATIVYGVMKSNQNYEPFKWKNNVKRVITGL